MVGGWVSSGMSVDSRSVLCGAVLTVEILSVHAKVIYLRITIFATNFMVELKKLVLDMECSATFTSLPFPSQRATSGLQHIKTSQSPSTVTAPQLGDCCLVCTVLTGVPLPCHLPDYWHWHNNFTETRTRFIPFLLPSQEF